MDRLKTASDLLRLAEILTADNYKYIYDPEHKKHPGGGYEKTEKGWQKGKQEKETGGSKMTRKKLEQKLNKLPEEKLYKIAKDPQAPQKLLDILSRHKSYSVRADVAHNGNTSTEILDKMSDDENFFVRDSVAGNKNTSLKTLEKLSTDSNANVRVSVAHNENTPPKILNALSDDDNAQVRRFVAVNKNTDTKVFDKLIKDESYKTACTVAGNPNANGQQLEYLCHRIMENYDESGNIKGPDEKGEIQFWSYSGIEDIANHKNTKIDTLKQIAQHWGEGTEIGDAARKNLKQKTQHIPPKATVNGGSVEEAYDEQDWNLGNGSYIREFLKDESIFKSKSFLNKAKEIAQAMKDGKTDFSDMELEDAFINVAKRVKSQYATLHTTKEDGGSDYATVGYMMGLRALDPNYNPYINEKPKTQEKPQSPPPSPSPSPVKPKGVRKNFLQRIEKAIQKGDTLSFRYTKKDGTVEKLAIKPAVVFEVNGKTAVRGFRDGIEDKDHIRMVYISSMGGDKPYIPARRKKTLQDFNEDQLVKLSQSKKIGDFELDYMAGHKSDAVRASAAKHPNCSAGTLQKLSKDRNEAVLYNVASNPSANSYILDKLARNPHIKEAETYMKIARNPNVSVETVNQLSLQSSVNSDITNEWSSKMPKVKNPFLFSQEFISGKDHAESGRNLATLFEARDYKVAGKAKGKTPQELKADFIANMNPSNYASMESFKKAEQRIKKMSPSDLQAMFAAIMDEEEE